MKARPGRSAGSMCTGATTAPRRETMRTELVRVEPVAGRVFRREVERLAASSRRRVGAGLHAGVVVGQPSAGGEPQRELGGQRIRGLLMRNGVERRARPLQRPLPQAPVQERLTGMGLVVARPAQAAMFLETRVAHAGVHRRERPQFVPHRLGVGRAPVVPHRPRQVEDDGEVLARLAGRVQRAPAALHATLAGGDRALRLEGAGRRGEHHVAPWPRYP